MGLRGPPPKPTALRIAEGNRSRRPLNEAEPTPTGEAACPAWLSPDAKKVWHQVAPICEKMGTLKDADVSLFAAFCDSVATFRFCHEALAKLGRIQQVINRRTRDCVDEPRPEVKMLEDSKKIMLQIGARFGLTPSDRSRINVGKTDDGDPFASLGAS